MKCVFAVRSNLIDQIKFLHGSGDQQKKKKILNSFHIFSLLTQRLGFSVGEANLESSECVLSICKCFSQLLNDKRIQYMKT